MTQLPTKTDLIKWIEDNPGKSSKRDIAHAFGIKGADRIDLKRLLKELTEEGHLEKRRKDYSDPDALPPVAVLLVRGHRTMPCVQTQLSGVLARCRVVFI